MQRRIKPDILSKSNVPGANDREHDGVDCVFFAFHAFITVGRTLEKTSGCVTWAFPSSGCQTRAVGFALAMSGSRSNIFVARMRMGAGRCGTVSNPRCGICRQLPQRDPIIPRARRDSGQCLDGLDALKTLEVLFGDEHRELLPRDVATALVDLDKSSLSLGESLHSPSQELRGPLYSLSPHRELPKCVLSQSNDAIDSYFFRLVSMWVLAFPLRTYIYTLYPHMAMDMLSLRQRPWTFDNEVITAGLQQMIPEEVESSSLSRNLYKALHAPKQLHFLLVSDFFQSLRVQLFGAPNDSTWA